MKTEVKSPKRKLTDSALIKDQTNSRTRRMWSDLGLTRMFQRVSSVPRNRCESFISSLKSLFGLLRRNPSSGTRKDVSAHHCFCRYISGFCEKFDLYSSFFEVQRRDETAISCPLRQICYSCVRINRGLGSRRRV